EDHRHNDGVFAHYRSTVEGIVDQRCFQIQYFCQVIDLNRVFVEFVADNLEATLAHRPPAGPGQPQTVATIAEHVVLDGHRNVGIVEVHDAQRTTVRIGNVVVRNLDLVG